MTRPPLRHNDDHDARRAAVALVLGVLDEGLTIADQVALHRLSHIAPPDRARAQRLALATLRALGPVDTVLKRHLRKSPPLALRAILQVATAEMLVLGAPAHGVVSAAVDLTRQAGRKAEGFAGLVNAVLRRVAETEDWATLPAQQLPGWLRGRLMAAYGKPAVIAMEQAHEAGAPLDLTPRGDAEAVAQAVGGEVLPTGSVRLGDAGQVSELPGYDTGDWWVQDAAAALPARLLVARPGERVLDLCAAPGGKTLQLAAAGAQVTALDLSESRMARLRDNLTRCGMTAETVVADALDWQPEAPFDAILLDAPCSATGTIRRHPELPFLRSAEGLKDLFALQARLIDRALAMLRPGGRLVFATCSLLPEEGERQIAAALARHPGLAVLPPNVQGIDPAWITPGGGLRTRPDYWADHGGLDGFFVALLQTPQGETGR